MTFMFMVIFVLIYTIITVRDVRTVLNTDREKAPPKKTLPFTKTINMDIWVVGTSNQHFVRGSYTESKFSKK